MADIAARREARRRKILENSLNRLKLITGETNGPISVAESDDTLSVLQNSNDEIEKEDTSVESISIKKSFHENCSDGFLENIITEDVNYPPLALVQNNQLETSSLTYYINRSKLYVVTLAIIIRLLFIFQMQFCVRDSIVLPFLIFELTLQYFRNPDDRNAFLNTFLLLSRLSPRRVYIITRILKFIENFTTDFCLYFFTFMILHVCLEYFN